jgi:hypothetical protein
LLAAGIALDAETGDVVAFGGQQRTGRQVGPSSAMWRWSGDRWEPVAGAAAPAARSGALLAPDPHTHGVLLVGGSTQTITEPACPSSSDPEQGCTGTVSPVRTLSDSWEFTGGVWRQLAAEGGIPQYGRLMASDPALDTVVLVGVSHANTPVPGTWEWAGHGWSELSVTAPTGADSLGYDPVSHLLIAYGEQEPVQPGPGMGAPATSGYSRTWAFAGTSWYELHPLTAPDRADGTLTASPDGHRLMLINTRGQAWTWTGQDWQPYLTRGGPATGNSPWQGTTLSAATCPSRHEIVLLATGGNTNDQTWTLHGDEWTLHPGTP